MVKSRISALRRIRPIGLGGDDGEAVCPDQPAVDDNQTTVRGLSAAGDIVRGLDQIVVAMGQAAIAATHIHNCCDLPVDGGE
ncbi:MAG: hypothetical protein QJR07_15235 [Acetobacteraceae bacterium]|nr:hypothetical protein [Acetobacteraceae bacterium]